MVYLVTIPSPVAAGGAGMWTYPSDASCPAADGLQSCIDGTNPGDTIQIATNSVDEFAQVRTSLTMNPATGFHPVFSQGMSVDPSTGSINVTLTGLEFDYLLNVEFDGGSGHQVTLDGVKIHPSGGENALVFLAYNPGTLTVKNSTISMNSSQFPVLATDFLSTGATKLVLIGDKIDAHGGSSTGTGVDLYFDSGSHAEVDIYNTSIWDVGTCRCGNAAGIGIEANGTSQSVVNLVGDTVDKSKTSGLSLRNDLTAGGSLKLGIYNSIFANAQDFGIALENASDPSLLTF
ncbi:MAG TPA: hypothetical protein VLK88_05100, partial [Gemmatimonadales bacterium]|nr:hypothetical protein [Gemmatimonadales bacterium]